MQTAAATNQQLADRLLNEGRIAPEVHRRAVAQAAAAGLRVEDVLIDLGIVGEQDLLKYVATIFKTRFVSTEKLYKATVDPRLIALISPKLADARQVFPVLYAADTDTLSIVTATPDDSDALKEVKLSAGVRVVQPLIARPAAVRAAIRRAYHNDPGGFAALLQPRPQAPPFGGARTTGNYAASEVPDEAPTVFRSQATNTGRAPVPDAIPVHFPRAHVPGPGGSIATVQAYPAAPAAAPLGAVPPGLTASSAPAVVAPPSSQHPSRAPMQSQPVAERPPPAPPPPRAVVDDDPDTNVRVPSIPFTDHVAMVRALVNALDAQRDNLVSHSSDVADWVRRLCERLEVPQEHTTSYVIAALLHDLGKDGAHHVTLLNVERSEACRAEAEATLDVPRRFFASVPLTSDTKSALRAMYERFDGLGIPMGKSGQHIHKGARILSVCDSYVDLVSRRNNPAGKKLEPPIAISYLKMHARTLFDPAVLEALRAEVGKEFPAVLTDAPFVLLVDPDQASTSQLEVQLIEHGFEVRTVRDTQSAVNELQHGATIAAVVSEVDLDSRDAGLRLRQRAASEPWGRNVPLWVLHTRRNESEIGQLAFDLEVDDLIPKPGRPDAIASKIKQLVDRKLQRARA